MPLNWPALQAELAENKRVDSSAKMLMERLFTEVEANKNDPAKLQAIIDEFRTHNAELAAAVVANTPGAPIEPPVEPPA